MRLVLSPSQQSVQRRAKRRVSSDPPAFCWKTEATAKYHYTSEPIAVDFLGADVTVIARVTGEFPGSPIELRYRFTLEGDKIARLEITG